jgi:hypothetical protein
MGVTQTLIALSPEELEDIISRAVRKALSTAAEDGMRPQTGSPLGPRRHCAAVKRRLATGQPGAVRAGRRYLLSEAALAEELIRLSATPAPEAASTDAGERLQRELRALRS